MLIFNNIEHQPDANYAMIMIHGYGGNQDSLKPLLNVLTFQKDVSFYFLQAPYKLNQDSYSWSYEIEPDVWERNEPKEMLDVFFNNVIFEKYKSQNVFLMGFSQGGFICFEYGLNITKQIGGVFPIAGFTEKTPSIHKSQIDTPVIIGHGINDKVINISSSENAVNYYSKIKNMNNVELVAYKGGHKIGLRYLKRVNQFMIQNNIR